MDTNPHFDVHSTNGKTLLKVNNVNKKTTPLQKHKISELNAVENALAGSGGAFLASFALCPTELIKCRLQALRETATNAAKASGSKITYEVTHM